MTSINAMRFDEYSGMCVCDEARSWNEENGRLLTAEKMRLITSEEVTLNTGAVVVMGKTGTSTLGNEYLETTKTRIDERFRKMAKEEGLPLKNFMTVKEMAHFLFRNLCDVKRKHIDYTLKARYGFTSNDFVAGFYTNEEGEKIEIKDQSVIDKVHKIMTWEGMAAESKSIFLNAQIVAGYEPREGFRIFKSSLIAPHCEAVHAIFTCDGSGVDSTDFVYTGFANTRSVPERRGKIDRVEGLVNLLEALLTANTNSAGCDGYIKIIYIDGRRKNPLERSKEIHDHRSQLAMEVVKGALHGFIPWKHAYDIVEGIVYEEMDFLEADEKMKRAAGDVKGLMDLLRGHKHYRLPGR